MPARPRSLAFRLRHSGIALLTGATLATSLLVALPTAQAAEATSPSVDTAFGYQGSASLSYGYGYATARTVAPLADGGARIFLQDRTWLDAETLGSRTDALTLDPNGQWASGKRVDLTTPDRSENGAPRHAVFVGAEGLSGDRVLFARDAAVARLVGNCLPTKCPLTLVIQRADGSTERTGTLTLGDAADGIAFRRDLTALTATSDGAPRVCETRKDGTVLVHGFSADLARDTDFGDNGVTTVPLSQCMGIDAAPDGATYVMGNAPGTDGLTKTHVTRLLSNGRVDTDFGTAGVLTIGGEGVVSKGIQLGLHAASDGSAYVGQVTRLATDRPWKGAVSHVLASGTLDADFGTSGTRVMDAESSTTTYVDAVLPTDSGVVVGTTRRMTEIEERRRWDGEKYVTYERSFIRDRLVLLRLTTAGAWDSSFVQPDAMKYETRAPLLVADQQGRLLVVTGGPLCERGSSTTFCKSSNYSQVWRLTP